MQAVQPNVTGRKPHSVEPLLMTMEDLQDVLRCGKTKGFELIKSGEIEAVSVGRRRMPVVESVKAYVARRREQAKSMTAKEAM